MSTLTVYPEHDASRVLLQTSEHTQISAELKRAGVRFERWHSDQALPPQAGAEAVLAAYAGQVAALRREGYTTVDVAAIAPEHPERAAMRQKFLSEHTHADDEVRFFVEGGGGFYLHLGEQVWLVECERGDLISVPANTRHWFDMGAAPRFTAIRFFRDPQGWVGHFTGAPIAAAFPSYPLDHAA